MKTKEKKIGVNKKKSGKRAIDLPGVFLGVIFIIFASVILFIYIKPFLASAGSGSWTEVPCNIASSDIKRHRGGKTGVTYKVNIVYFYELNGIRHSSGRYNFMDNSLGSSEEERKIFIDNYKAGQKSFCYVNPGNPSESVIQKKIYGNITPPVIFLLLCISVAVFITKQKLIH